MVVVPRTFHGQMWLSGKARKGIYIQLSVQNAFHGRDFGFQMPRWYLALHKHELIQVLEEDELVDLHSHDRRDHWEIL